MEVNTAVCKWEAAASHGVIEAFEAMGRGSGLSRANHHKPASHERAPWGETRDPGLDSQSKSPLSASSGPIRMPRALLL